MPDMREEFETWHHAEFGYCIPEEEDTLAVGECAKRWQVWKASRAALKVELPKPEYFGDHWSGDWAYNVEDTKEALQQAGIEVVK